MMKILSVFAADEAGATAIEYGALVAFIAVGVMLLVESIGLSIQDTFLELKAIIGGSAASGTRS